ncbi:MAG: 4-oxalomesaconate tautomerase [Bacteroidota bacterium]
MQKAIPFMQFRGGSSKGLFFKAADLPTDEKERNQTILAAMEGAGIGDPRQIDGLGGGDSLTAKAAIVSLSQNEDADLDYFFLQIMIGQGKVSTAQTCGNILAAVAPFAIESGLILAADPTTRVKINLVNTGGLCEVLVNTPGGQVQYAGEAKVDGVFGTAAPIICNYLDTAGATCGQLFPTGNLLDIFDEKEVTCVDNGMPIVILKASDFGISGNETKAALDANFSLKQDLERIRLKMGYRMNLGDVTEQSIPKMCLISSAQKGGLVSTRMFIPHVCHEAIGVLAAVSVATACVLPGTVAEGIASKFPKNTVSFSIEHPTGEFTVHLETGLDENGQFKIEKSGVMRTARLLSRGEVFLPY